MPQRKALNHNAFNSKTLNEKQKYWLGFLFADGCVSSSNSDGNPQITLSLKSSDYKHIEKFKSFMGSNHKIIKDSNNNPIFRFRSEQVPKDLERYGIIERKGYEGTKVQYLQDDISFWRGVADGDGSITPAGQFCRFSMYGCKSVVEQWKEFTLNYIDNEVTVQHKKHNTYGYVLNGSYAKKILQELYINQDIALERKERRAISHLTSHDYTQE